MQSAVPKQFLLLQGKPVLYHTIAAFYQADTSTEIILVLPVDQFAYWENWAQENEAIITKGKRYGFSIVSKKNKEAGHAGLCNRVEEAPLKKYLRKYNLLNNKHIPNEIGRAHV